MYVCVSTFSNIFSSETTWPIETKFHVEPPWQGGHWSGKSQGNLIFLQGQGKVREFCKLVREILNTKKVREKSGNFVILAKICVITGILTTWKLLIFSLARSKLWKLVYFRTFCAKKLFKDFICFICGIREVHFSELVKGICYLSAREEK